MKQITQKSVAKYLTFMALVGILLFGARGLTAYAATTVDSGDCGAEGADVTWTLDSDGKLTISGEGKMADYDVFFDSDTDTYDYSKASPWSKDHREKVETVEITGGVTSIGWDAFSVCSSLTSITIPDSVKEIGNWAFGGCTNLRSVTIGNSVTSIGDGAFNGCSSLASITIPNSVTSIGWDALMAVVV
ncbi:MAG: leucine-rich repeat domain-containing protein [Lachnospiraceae bacterium]|nr:leucine-rich repeat domain-containing protein [Lachnospiraceae bacterium]